RDAVGVWPVDVVPELVHELLQHPEVGLRLTVLDAVLGGFGIRYGRLDSESRAAEGVGAGVRVRVYSGTAVRAVRAAEEVVIAQRHITGNRIPEPCFAAAEVLSAKKHSTGSRHGCLRIVVVPVQTEFGERVRQRRRLVRIGARLDVPWIGSGAANMR